ncbi:MAG: CRISPR system precrRNA processing endoribonuclease RAMP protein Cas6 [Caldilineaceae bacterium]
MSTMYTTSRPSPPATPPLATRPTIPLTAHHIRFTARAITPILFDDFKGSSLRGAFATVLRHTFCPQSQRDPETEHYHQALCPVCRLLSGEADDPDEGDTRRAYAIEPPPEAPSHFAPGATFTFGAALYGESWAMFPYVALAAGGMGEFGVGRKVAGGDVAGGEYPPPATRHSPTATRGKFVIEQIDAVNPLTGETRCMMAPEERMVRTETLPVTDEDVRQATEQLLAHLAMQGNQLTLDFLTPMRLVTQGEHTAKTPDFFPLIKQTVKRILDLAHQHGQGRPTIAGAPVVLKRDIYPYADQVHLVADQTHWWDVKGYSSRLGRQQVLGGYIGRATYHAPDWRPLLPWLLWGQSTHVGKNVVKGCGVYRVAGGEVAGRGWRVVGGE